MNFSQFDSYSGLFHFPTESPLSDFQENGHLLMGCQMIDPIHQDNDNDWLNDDNFVTTTLKSTPACLSKESPYPQRTSLLDIKKRKLSDLPESEPLVTNTNHFIYKDDFSWDDSKELPDVILVSPRKEFTPEREPNINTFFNSDDKKSNNSLNLDFDDILQNVQVEVGMDYSVDLVTKKDVEYFDDLLAGFADYQPIQNFDQDLFIDKAENNVDASDLNSFNEISCNINQHSATTDSQSAIKKLLKDDSFKGNFCKKKSTEILSEIDQWHDCFAEHNYFSPSKVSKLTNSETPICTIESKTTSDSAFVPIVIQDYAVETEISGTSESSIDLKAPELFLLQSSSAKKSSKPTDLTENCDMPKNQRKPVCPKATVFKSHKDDPTNKSYVKKPMSKKSQLPKSKAVSKPEPIAPPKVTSNCNGAKLLRISPKSSSCEPKLRIPPPMASKASSISRCISQGDKFSYSNDPVPFIKPNPVDLANPSTPLASPTRDDFTDQNEFTNQNSSQPETLNSNVDIVDPIQRVEPTPKVVKKKISVEEYLKKRAIKITPAPEPIESLETVESAPLMPIPNIEDIVKSILKSKLPLPNDKSPKLNVKSEPTHPAIIKSEPSRPKVHKPITKPKRNPTTESKQQPKEQQNSVPLKLIKVAIPDRAPVTRSFSVSPNEVSQSLESCDRYSSSGVSSYQNSSVSSMCGSPFTINDDKCNNIKYFDKEKRLAKKCNKPMIEKKLPEIPFAVNKELLRKDRSSRRQKHRRENRRESDWITRKRKLSDSCFEDDSDCSDYSDRKRSRKRYNSSSSSSSEKSHHYRSHKLNCSISYSNREFYDWKYYSQQNIVPDPYIYRDFNEIPPNMYYPVPPPTAWHPDFGSFYPPFAPNMEVPYFYNCSHESMEKKRLALFVGNIENGLDEKELTRRFQKYGDITHVKLHFREGLSNYGFVYFTEERYVQRAIKYGSNDPDLPHYKLGVGMRKERYADRRSFTYEKKIPVLNFPNQGNRNDSFNLKLEKFKNDLKQKKLNDRYK